MDQERFVLSLLELPKVGRKSAWKILRSVKGVPQTASEFFQTIAESPETPKSTNREVSDKAWDASEKILADTAKQMMVVLAATRDEFPAWLRSIPDPPIALFMKGNTECVHDPASIAVIGTREPSEWGKKCARRFGERGAQAGCVIVSGLAHGCDSEAHRGCLDGGGKAVAVLAHGLDKIYPRESKPLADEILDTSGCWVSEYPPGMRAQRSFFVERDRLQSGLSGGVIVVETDIEGGTMHTVGFAESQGRLLACLEHPDDKANDKSRGTAMLIQTKRAVPLKLKDDLPKFLDAVKTAANKWAHSPGLNNGANADDRDHL